LDLRVLIVDDMATMRRILRGTLEQLGFSNIDEAEGGTFALPMIQQGSYELLITDWNMPDMAGIDLVKAVRAEEKYNDMPIVMVTAEAKKEQVVEAVKAGVNGYVIKPFTPAGLKEKLDKVLH